jgi:hypothetical protein
VVVSDRALTAAVLKALLHLLELAWRGINDLEEKFEIAQMAAAVVVAWAAAFWGEELPLAHLKETREDCELAARHCTLVYVCVALRGQFKNEIGVKWYHHLLAAITNGSKIDVQIWLYRLLGVYQRCGISNGPLFQQTLKSSKAARVSNLDVHFHRFLLRVQEERPDLIPASVDVEEEYSMKRSPC